MSTEIALYNNQSIITNMNSTQYEFDNFTINNNIEYNERASFIIWFLLILRIISISDRTDNFADYTFIFITTLIYYMIGGIKFFTFIMLNYLKYTNRN